MKNSGYWKFWYAPISQKTFMELFKSQKKIVLNTHVSFSFTDWTNRCKALHVILNRSDVESIFWALEQLEVLVILVRIWNFKSQNSSRPKRTMIGPLVLEANASMAPSIKMRVLMLFDPALSMYKLRAHAIWPNPLYVQTPYSCYLTHPSLCTNSAQGSATTICRRETTTSGQVPVKCQPPPPIGRGKFIKTVGRISSCKKRKEISWLWGRNITWKKGKGEEISSSL